MKQKILFIILLVFLLTGGIASSCNAITGISTEEVLINSFKSSQARIMESTMSCWVKLNDSFCSQSQVEKEMDRITDQLGTEKKSATSSSESSNDSNKEIIYTVKGNKSYCISVESVRADTRGETYAVIDISIDGNYSELTAERNKVEALFAGQGKTLKIYSCIIGTFDGKLSESQLQSKTKTVLNSIKANKVEGLETDDMSSISAFSGKIGSFIVSNDKKVNVQVAMRYSSYDDKTYIWIGSPLIPVEY